MQNDIKALLRSDSPDQRMRAVNQLLHHPTDKTPSLLETIAQKDPDPTVRDYAQRALAHLKNQNSSSSKNRQEEAHFFLDEANNAMIAGEVKEARTFARRAFKLHPRLARDDLARDVAVFVMKMPADDAIELLLSDRDLFEVDRAFRKKMGYYSDENWLDRVLKHYNKWDVTWREVAVDVIFYILVITLPILLLLIVASSVLAGSFAVILSRDLIGQPALVKLYISTIDYGADFLTLGFIFLTVVMVAGVLFFVFAFQMILTHVSLNWFLGGDGSFRRLIHHALIPVTGYSLFLWTMLLLTPFLYTIGLGQLVEAGMIDVFNLFGFMVFVINLSQTIGKAYQVDLGKGCLAMMLPYLTLGCFGCTVLTLRFGRVIYIIFTGR